MPSFELNGRPTPFEQGQTILEAARAAGVDIPTLCYIKDRNDPAACRICVVEIEGMARLMPACRTKAAEGMKVQTESERVIASRKTTLDLICRHHRMDCEYCPNYTYCELHALLRRYGMDDRIYSRVYHERRADESSACIVRDSSKCVLCRRCMAACEAVGVMNLGALGRGEQTKIEGALPLAESTCIGCGQCVKNCPTGALFVKNEQNALWQAINDKKALHFAVSEESAADIGRFFGEDGGDDMGKVTAFLRKIGAAGVYAVGGLALEGAEETAEKIAQKHQDGSVMLSLCPAAIRFFVGRDDLVAAKHPEAIFDEKIKAQNKNAFTVYISGCTALKQAHRCDTALTTAELFEFFRRACVSRFTLMDVWKKLVPETPDDLNAPPFGDYRTQVCRILEEKYGLTLKAVGYDDLKAAAAAQGYDLIESMACSGGCINGGGQFRRIKED